MRELERKQRVKQILYSVPALSLLAIITFFMTKGAYGIMRIERESANKVNNLEKETEGLSFRQRGLEESIRKLQTEEGIMEEIKQKFSVTRGGEHVAVLVDERKIAKENEPKEAWYKRVLDAIIFWK